jgi:hypothetical protein
MFDIDISVCPPCGFDLSRNKQVADLIRYSGFCPNIPVKIAIPRIWNNVEKDQRGHTILRDGNCFRILNDPSVANQSAYENFE